MSQFPGQPQFGNPLEIEKALKNKNTLTSNSMKVRLLKDIGAENKGMIGNQYFAKGSIIDVDVLDGGKIVYAQSLSSGKRNYPLTIGTDVELITDAPQGAIVTKQQKGGLLFYGALAILGYIVYKVVTTK
jgi:hypothetical protein